MIQISRMLARQLRSVFRKLASREKTAFAKVSLLTGPDGLRVRLHQTDILAEYHQAGEFSAAQIIIPLQAFADFEGRSDTAVTLETVDASNARAQWEDAGVPQVTAYRAQDQTKLPAFPAAPASMLPIEPAILNVLAEASLSASSDNLRYATNNVQLRGSAGTIIATNGHQLLQTRFQLPWKADVLIPASNIYGAKELPHDGPVSIGKTDTHVAIQTGSWTLFLPIDKEGRFPKTDGIIPKQEDATAHCHLHADDAEFLIKALAHLPGGDDEHAPVTLDLDGRVCIRARAEGQEQTVELVLARSEATGSSVRTALNRNFLARAVQLGSSEFHVLDAKKPLLFKDEKHEFVIVPLVEAALVLPPSEHATQITSTKEPSPAPIRRINPVNESNGTNGDALSPAASNGNGTNGTNGVRGTRTRKAKNTGLAALIEEADALKGAMRELCSRSHRLVVALKRHRKQNRLVQTSLKALKDLQQIDA